MKKIYTALLATMLGASMASAQETYTNNYLINTSDLFGTARYVGMGGALGALGADISAISSNPAAIGMFRRSAVSFTLGGIRQTDNNIDGERQSRCSFDQMGFVVSVPMDNSYVNFAVNYQKKNNLSHAFLADGADSRFLGDYVDGVFNGVRNPDDYINPIVETAIDAGLYRPGEVEPCAVTSNDADFDGSNFKRVMAGFTSSFDINLSFNHNNRLFGGVTVGIDNLNYRSNATFDEFWWRGEQNHSYTYDNHQKIEGWGFNVKLGFIARPIEDSPFRLGLTIETPTWYKIDYYGDGQFISGYAYNAYNKYFVFNDKDNFYYTGENALTYNLDTPWKFRVSAGHTFGSWLAVGAEYEYAGYQYASMAYPDEDYRDYGDWTGIDETKDRAMNRQTRQALDGVHSFKVGAEVKPTANFALRAGYNYYSSSCKKDGFTDHAMNSYATQFLTASDYMQLGDVNIMTFGVGYADKHFYADVAYKYRAQKADFFHYPDYSGYMESREIALDRHQFFVTLGYKF